jgi:hypothetical protein
MHLQHRSMYLTILTLLLSYQDAASSVASHVEERRTQRMSNVLGSPQEGSKICGSPHVEEEKAKKKGSTRILFLRCTMIGTYILRGRF